MAPIPSLLTSLLVSSAFVCTRTSIDQKDERVVTTCNEGPTSTFTSTLDPDLSITSSIISISTSTSSPSSSIVADTPSLTVVAYSYTPTTVGVKTPNSLIVARDEGAFDEDAWINEAFDEDAWINDAFNEDAWINDAFNEDAWIDDAFNEDAWIEDAFNEDAWINDAFNEDAWINDAFDEDAWINDASEEDSWNAWMNESYEDDDSADVENHDDSESVAIEVTELADEADIVAGVDANENLWNTSGAESWTQDVTATETTSEIDEVPSGTDQETEMTNAKYSAETTVSDAIADNDEGNNEVDNEVEANKGEDYKHNVEPKFSFLRKLLRAKKAYSTPTTLSTVDVASTNTSTDTNTKNNTNLLSDSEEAYIINAYNQSRMRDAPEHKKKETSGVLSCVIFLVVVFCVLFPTLEK
ncbi:unnamed protein product [Ambrosiozyma monospora]|uniref:Unnamed protein product n=1 Tax=Ambrosiozyma monospora TaxID=43982 RepID=A0A9W6Z4U0_AMBMO|nr:unnamed protein product [Ambrosiozyma monospora]